MKTAQTLQRRIVLWFLLSLVPLVAFGIFSYLVMVLGKVFYPESGIATIATFATFSVAFLARPLGGMFFGPLGDRIGRQKVLAEQGRHAQPAEAHAGPLQKLAARQKQILRLGRMLLQILPGRVHTSKSYHMEDEAREAKVSVDGGRSRRPKRDESR